MMDGAALRNGDKTQSPKDHPLWEHGGLMIHETCDITDHMWTFGYLLMATGDAVWGDRIERIFFNAAPGAVTEDFRAVQYFSSPNQAFASRRTGHPGFGEVGLIRQAYRPGCDTECCAGNVHRMAPAYIARMWMLDKSGRNPAAMLYGDSVFAFTAENGAKVTVAAGGTLVLRDDTDASLVSSGSFESPTTGDFKKSAPTGWTRSLTDDSGAYNNTDGAGYCSDSSSNLKAAEKAPDGNQTAYLRNYTKLDQSVKAAAAGTYRLSFWQAVRTGSFNSHKLTVEVFVDNSIISN